MLPDAPAGLEDLDPTSLGLHYTQTARLDIATEEGEGTVETKDGFFCSWDAGSKMYAAHFDLPVGKLIVQLYPTEVADQFYAFTAFDAEHSYALRLYDYHLSYDESDRLVELGFSGVFEALIAKRNWGPTTYDVYSRFGAEGRVAGVLPDCTNVDTAPWWWPKTPILPFGLDLNIGEDEKAGHRRRHARKPRGALLTASATGRSKATRTPSAMKQPAASPTTGTTSN